MDYSAAIAIFLVVSLQTLIANGGTSQLDRIQRIKVFSKIVQFQEFVENNIKRKFFHGEVCLLRFQLYCRSNYIEASKCSTQGDI